MYVPSDGNAVRRQRCPIRETHLTLGPIQTKNLQDLQSLFLFSMPFKYQTSSEKTASMFKELLDSYLSKDTSICASNILAESLHECLTGQKQWSPNNVYLLMRELYWQTKGMLNNCITSIISLYNPRVPFPSGSFLTEEDIQRCISSLNTGGYAILPSFFSMPDVLNLRRELFGVHAKTPNGASSRIMVELSQLMSSRWLQNVATSNDFQYIASTYFGAYATLNRLAAWRTVFVGNDKHLSGDAMMYHYDHDHNRHLKFFIYLTDVCQNSGPHVYIPMSARRNIPYFISHSGRYSDNELESAGLTGITVVAPAGTLIIADTQNLHKGTPIRIPGHIREIVEFQYVDLSFGKRVPTIQWLT